MGIPFERPKSRDRTLAMADINIEEFISQLNLEKDKYIEMTAIAEEQKKTITDNNTSNLLKLLERKSVILKDIEDIERNVSTVKSSWNEIRQSIDPALRGRVEDIVDEISNILKTLVALEEEGRNILEGRRDSTSEEIKSLRVKKQARNAYDSGDKSDNRFVDKDGV